MSRLGARRCSKLVALTVLGLSAMLGAAAPQASAATNCDRVASPSGSDSNSGLVTSPFRTVQKLDNTLRSGETGCLRGGSYGNSRTETRFSTPDVTIRSYPGERAVVRGWPYVDGRGTTLSHLNFDLNNVGHTTSHCAHSGGRTPSAYSLQIEASDVTIEYDNVYQNDVPLTQRSVGIGVSWNVPASGVVIRYNRIHDVGWCPVEDHAVYLDHVSGAQVYDNWMYDLPGGTGVELWSTTTNARIYSNVIDQAASGITLGCCAASGEAPSNGNLIEHNLVTNTVGVRYANLDPLPATGPDRGETIWTYWSGRPGGGNVYRDNLAYCSSGVSHCGTSPGTTAGLAYVGNVVANPRFADPDYKSSHDYRVAPTSPAASWGLWNGSDAAFPNPLAHIAQTGHARHRRRHSRHRARARRR